MTSTRVHLVRHGQVDNPHGILYGTAPGYGLSSVGRAMAQRLGEHFRGADVAHLRCSPLQRAQETMAPIAAAHADLGVLTDERVIEAENTFAGRKVDLAAFARPRAWWWLRNPLRPSWGEPYASIAARMRAAVLDAAQAAGDGEAVVVSHQLPIWIARCDGEGRSFVHLPPQRQCGLGSVTTLTLRDGHVTRVAYAEPCADLLGARP